MFHIAGLTARGIELACKLFEQAQKGLITDREYRTELWSLRQKHVVPGYMWVAGNGTAYLVKIMGKDTFLVPSWAEEDAEDGFCETFTL